MRNKRHAGVTLIEIILAVGILAVVVGPVLLIFQASTQANVAARKITIASFTAQLYMEELVGLTEEDLREKFEEDGSDDSTGTPITVEIDDYNGFFLSAEVDFGHTFDLGGGDSYSSDALAFAFVEISADSSSAPLSRYENILRVQADEVDADEE